MRKLATRRTTRTQVVLSEHVAVASEKRRIHVEARV
jgi:hypothetical protein